MRNDVLMPTSDVTPNGLATASCILIPDTIIGGDILVIRAPEGVLNGEFLAYAIKTQRNQVMQLVSGTTVFHLYGRDMANFCFAVPSVDEQRAIAAVLSNVDDLIGSLEALIAKKRDIKQASMQQLLTGRTRLPGFGGEWDMTRLGDHLTFLRHGAIPRSELTSDGTVKYVHYGDIHKAADVYLNPNVRPMPTLAADRARLLDRLDDGDLVFVDASEDIEGIGKSVEVKGLQGQQIVSGLHTIAARFRKCVLADGFKAYLQFCPAFRHHLRQLAAGDQGLRNQPRSHRQRRDPPSPSPRTARHRHRPLRHGRRDRRAGASPRQDRVPSNRV